MNKTDSVFLPGLEKQFIFINNKLNLIDLNVLIAGSGTYEIAKELKIKGNNVEIIVEEYESLMNMNLYKNEADNIPIKLMDFERTDYSQKHFDLVYAQGSISNFRRNKIIKEFNRLIAPDGYLCVGEVLKLEEEIPSFMDDLFNYSNIDPFTESQLIAYYKERRWEVADSIDLSYTLKEYYQKNLKLLKEKIKTLRPNEISYYKKILNQITHESNVYLKLGGKKYVGFKTFLLKRV